MTKTEDTQKALRSDPFCDHAEPEADGYCKCGAAHFTPVKKFSTAARKS